MKGIRRSINGIGMAIRTARQERRLGVNELAKLAGVSGAAVSRWENGERIPRLEEFIRVAGVLHLDYRDFFDTSVPGLKKILDKMSTNSEDIKLVLAACPDLTPEEVDIIMRIITSKEKEARRTKKAK